MSHLHIQNRPGHGETAGYQYKIIQAVQAGEFVECAGVGGWNADGYMPDTPEEEIAQAFKNAHDALQTVSRRIRWKHVYKVRTYLRVPLGEIPEEAAQQIQAQLKKWCPDQEPLWTSLGVTAFERRDMNVMIEVYAHASDMEFRSNEDVYGSGYGK